MSDARQTRLLTRERPSCRLGEPWPIFGSMPASARLFAFFAALAVLPATAAEIRSAPDRMGGIVLTISGPIVPGDGKRVQDILGREYRPDRPVTVVLDSPGGDLDAGMWIARTIATAQARSAVPAGRMCASVCFLAWAAGTDRTAEPGAKVGIHTAAASKIETDEARAYTLDMARAANLYRVPLDIIGRMVVTKNREMHWLDEREIRSMTGPRP